MTYWNLDQVEVEDLMTNFMKKSLAQSEYDGTLDSYVYSIHDLQLDYLKSQLKEDSEQERVRYDKSFGGDWNFSIYLLRLVGEAHIDQSINLFLDYFRIE